MKKILSIAWTFGLVLHADIFGASQVFAPRRSERKRPAICYKDPEDFVAEECDADCALKSRRGKKAIEVSPAPKRVREKVVAVVASSYDDGFSLDTIIKMRVLCLEYADEMRDKGARYSKDGNGAFVQCCIKAEEKAHETAKRYQEVVLAAKDGEDVWAAVKRIFDLHGEAEDLGEFFPVEPSDTSSDASTESTPCDNERYSEDLDFSSLYKDFPECFEDAFLNTIGHIDVSAQENYCTGFFDGSLGLETCSLDPAYQEGYLAGIAPLLQ